MTYQIVMVPIRQLFDAEGKQVCDTGDETCHFLVKTESLNFTAIYCNHCQRGVPNNKPHRLCPVLKKEIK
jgi:hypothetical protein